MTQWMVRYLLWNKRLLKKPGFVMILCFVLLLVAGLRLASREESGLLHIALYAENPQDPLTGQVWNGLLEDNSVLVYHVCDTEMEARKLLDEGGVDAVWLFPDHLARSIRASAQGGGMRPVVTVIERQEDVALMFSREILLSALYPAFSYAVFENFVRDDLGLEITEEELRAAYDRTPITDSLFEITYMDGETEDEEVSYLLAPLRGLLSLWLVLCGFTASLYMLEDEKKGVFQRLPMSRRPLAALGVQWVLLSDGVLLLLAACKLTGVFTSLGRELLAVLLFAGCIMMFCTAAGLLLGTPERLGACIPIIILGMALLCPIFLNVNAWKPLQYLLPPYYYLKSIHSSYHLYGMVLYLLVSAGVCLLLWQWRKSAGYRKIRRTKE